MEPLTITFDTDLSKVRRELSELERTPLRLRFEGPGGDGLSRSGYAGQMGGMGGMPGMMSASYVPPPGGMASGLGMLPFMFSGMTGGGGSGMLGRQLTSEIAQAVREGIAQGVRGGMTGGAGPAAGSTAHTTPAGAVPPSPAHTVHVDEHYRRPGRRRPGMRSGYVPSLASLFGGMFQDGPPQDVTNYSGFADVPGDGNPYAFSDVDAGAPYRQMAPGRPSRMRRAGSWMGGQFRRGVTQSGMMTAAFGAMEVAGAFQSLHQSDVAARYASDPLEAMQARQQGIDAVSGGMFGGLVSMPLDWLGIGPQSARENLQSAAFHTRDSMRGQAGVTGLVIDRMMRQATPLGQFAQRKAAIQAERMTARNAAQKEISDAETLALLAKEDDSPEYAEIKRRTDDNVALAKEKMKNADANAALQESERNKDIAGARRDIRAQTRLLNLDRPGLSEFQRQVGAMRVRHEGEMEDVMRFTPELQHETRTRHDTERSVADAHESQRVRWLEQDVRGSVAASNLTGDRMFHSANLTTLDNARRQALRSNIGNESLINQDFDARVAAANRSHVYNQETALMGVQDSLATLRYQSRRDPLGARINAAQTASQRYLRSLGKEMTPDIEQAENARVDEEVEKFTRDYNEDIYRNRVGLGSAIEQARILNGNGNRAMPMASRSRLAASMGNLRGAQSQALELFQSDPGRAAQLVPQIFSLARERQMTFQESYLGGFGGQEFSLNRAATGGGGEDPIKILTDIRNVLQALKDAPQTLKDIERNTQTLDVLQ